MGIGAFRHRVTLGNPPDTPGDADGYYEPLEPAVVWAAIEPLSPGGGDTRQLQHLVRMHFHPQVSIDTRLTLEDDRKLYVRGLQDVDNRHRELRLLCEEVI